jgi:putative Mg2+ transporter-C (MgtC) family protein
MEPTSSDRMPFMAEGLTTFLISPSAHEVAYFLGRSAVALLLGALIGLERQWHQRMAGLRTNALVALGSALFVMLGILMLGSLAVDPTRIAAYVVSGVGFLGAGVILRDGVNVRGINTAATIWCSAAVGLLAGAGYLVEAAIGALLVVGVHAAGRPVARRIDRLPPTEESEVETVYRFRAVCRAADEAHVRALLVQSLVRDEFVLRALHSHDLDRGGTQVEVEAELQSTGRNDIALEGAVSRLSLEPGVTSVRWSVAQDAPVMLAAEEQ